MNSHIAPINILIADDHQMFIDGLILLLKRVRFIQTVFQALNGREALEVISKNNIDFVISDINMPEISGIELTKIIKSQYPHIKVLVLTMYNDKEIVKEIIKSEAEGYVLKNTGKHELIIAINKIADNGTYYCNEVFSILEEEHKSINRRTDAQNSKNPEAELSVREIEILKLICNEFTTAEIAEKLFISKFTVDTHRKHILHKTNSKTIVGMIKYSINNKII